MSSGKRQISAMARQLLEILEYFLKETGGIHNAYVIRTYLFPNTFLRGLVATDAFPIEVFEESLVQIVLYS